MRVGLSQLPSEKDICDRKHLYRRNWKKRILYDYIIISRLPYVIPPFSMMVGAGGVSWFAETIVFWHDVTSAILLSREKETMVIIIIVNRLPWFHHKTSFPVSPPSLRTLGMRLFIISCDLFARLSLHLILRSVQRKLSEFRLIVL